MEGRKNPGNFRLWFVLDPCALYACTEGRKSTTHLRAAPSFPGCASELDSANISVPHLLKVSIIDWQKGCFGLPLARGHKIMLKSSRFIWREQPGEAGAPGQAPRWSRDSSARAAQPEQLCPRRDAAEPLGAGTGPGTAPAAVQSPCTAGEGQQKPAWSFHSAVSTL